jgi:hypothetical protein
MLQHLPHWLGEALRDRRAGFEKLAISSSLLGSEFESLELRSPAFADNEPIPPRFTADGAGVSPPLEWTGAPDGTRSLVLIVEDPDAPSSDPLVHAILFDIPPRTNWLDEGAIDHAEQAAIGETGRNSYLRTGWLPPDPPTGHGPHHYAFQLFALDTPLDFTGHTGRGALLGAMAGHILAAGLLIGTYERG